jgi:hypothetical protein
VTRFSHFASRRWRKTRDLRRPALSACEPDPDLAPPAGLARETKLRVIRIFNDIGHNLASYLAITFSRP